MSFKMGLGDKLPFIIMYNFPYFALEFYRAMAPEVNNNHDYEEPLLKSLQNNLVLRKELIYIHIHHHFGSTRMVTLRPHCLWGYSQVVTDYGRQSGIRADSLRPNSGLL